MCLKIYFLLSCEYILYQFDYISIFGCCCMWTSPWANSQDWIVRGLLHNCTNEINPNSSTLENVVIWNRAFLFRKFTLSETDPSFFAD